MPPVNFDLIDRRIKWGLLLVSLATLALLIYAVLAEGVWSPWRRLRQEHAQILKAKANDDRGRMLAEQFEITIQQDVLPELRTVDRCLTCHPGLDDPRLAAEKQPFRTHPGNYLLHHPPEKFGCTICHRGQGRAITEEAAHGDIAQGERPMLPMKYIESSCAKCHLPSDMPQAPKLSRGRAVFNDLGCIGCHKLHGRGGLIGPELEGVGARRSPEWLIAHFKDPAAVTPGSAMPPIKVGEDDLEALTLYVLSFTGEEMGAYYVSAKTIPSPMVGRKLFEQKGCIGCHSIGGEGGAIGPALDGVVKRRTPDWIMAHFRDPQTVSPGSVMPQFDFTEQESRALTAFLLQKSDSNTIGFLKIPALMNPVERGKAVYRKYGCAACHDRDGVGGVPNPNAKTAQQVPSLKYVAESYTKSEVKKRILDGQREIVTLDPQQPAPPLYMPPWRGRISESELDDLTEYLMSLFPKEEKTEF